MANRENGEIALTVKGKTYTLVLNTSVMASLEDHFSTPDDDVTWDVIWTRVLRGSVKTIRALIWMMLQAHHPTMTIEDTGQLIDAAGGFEQFARIIREAGKSATPDPKDAKELGVAARPRKAQTGRGTGAGSTSTRVASV